MAAGTASLAFSLATSHSGRAHGPDHHQMPDFVNGRRKLETTSVSNCCHAWGPVRVSSFGTPKIGFRVGFNSRGGSGADFIRLLPSQCRVGRITATRRLDDDELQEESEIHGGSDGSETTSLEDENTGKEVRIDLQLPRRRLLVEFTCNVCQTRTQRLVSPEAYKRGTVYVQCGGCEAYHQLVDNLGLVVEYDFRKETDSDSS